jgi:hypothetical protein
MCGYARNSYIRLVLLLLETPVITESIIRIACFWKNVKNTSVFAGRVKKTMLLENV